MMRFKNWVKNLSIFLVLGLLLSCASRLTKPTDEPQRVPASAAEQLRLVYLNQGWSAAERQDFYHKPQGSYLMPLDWARNLELTNGTVGLLTRQSMDSFGYISEANNLPVGFTAEERDGKHYLGMNCAACHTSQLRYGNTVYRIDGGASLSNFQRFVDTMDAAVATTLTDTRKFNQFARRVLGSRAQNQAEVQRLRNEFQTLATERRGWQTRNHANMQYGYGRNDAFGIIFNQVLGHDLGVPSNNRIPDAPVSYPVLWDTHQHQVLQWVGIASNNKEPRGPLSRNIGQVLGVFGHIDFRRMTQLLNGYCNTARRDNLETLENISAKLWSPAWPQGLPALDHANVQRGAELYRIRCLHCHSVMQHPRDLNRVVGEKMIAINQVGTDPKAAYNAAERPANTGRLRGAKLLAARGRELEAVEPAAIVLKHAVAGALAGSISPLTCRGQIDTDLQTILEGWRNVAKGLFSREEAEDRGGFDDRMQTNRNLLMRYKARPLNGIWASAPYLHNGSVKNLSEMLKSPAQRSQRFAVGCIDFDADKVGYECAEGQANTSIFDTRVAGNSNQGHDFARGLSEPDRMALLEYLKSL